MILLDSELKKIGLQEHPIITDQQLKYKSFDFNANRSYICINNILDSKNNIKEQVFSINDREIKKKLSLIQIKNFIDLIQ